MTIELEKTGWNNHAQTSIAIAIGVFPQRTVHGSMQVVLQDRLRCAALRTEHQDAGYCRSCIGLKMKVGCQEHGGYIILKSSSTRGRAVTSQLPVSGGGN
jgi:hypothetical protein